MYAYVRNDPLNAIDVSGNRVIFIGGGGDGYPRGTPGRSSTVRDYRNRFAAQGNVPGGAYFFRNYDRNQIMRSISEGVANGEPIVIVGHSWGASGANIDLLVTVDPVGQGHAPDRPSNVRTWVNITANPIDPNEQSNIVAEIGGKPSGVPVDQADINVQANANHEDFERMLGSHSFDGMTTEDLIRSAASQ